MSYTNYVYLTALFTGFCGWVAFGSNWNVDVQLSAVIFGSLGMSLLIMMGLYELTSKKKVA